MRMRLPGAELPDRPPARAGVPVASRVPVGVAETGRTGPRCADRSYLLQHALGDAAAARGHCPASGHHARHHRGPGERRRLLAAALARDVAHRAQLLRASAARSAADPVADAKPDASLGRLRRRSADAIERHASAGSCRPPFCARTRPGSPARRPEAGAVRARMFALSAPLVLAAAAFYLAQAAPAPLYRAIGLLPAPIAGTARAGHGQPRALFRTAPRRAPMDRRRRSPVAQSRQIADKQPVASPAAFLQGQAVP